MARRRKGEKAGDPLPPHADPQEAERDGPGLIADLIAAAAPETAEDAGRKMAAASAAEDLQKLSARDRRINRIYALAAPEIVEPFIGGDGAAYATVRDDGRSENLAIEGSAFIGWLAGLVFDATGAVPEDAELKAVGRIVRALANRGPRLATFRRFGAEGGKAYLDLVDDRRRVVEIDGAGFRVLDRAPVKFLRHSSALPLPEPVATEASLEQLLGPLLNVGTQGDFYLIASWMVGAFFPAMPQPILALSGEQGSGKSFKSRVLRNIVDPSSAALRVPPEDLRDLTIAGNCNGVLAWDNVSAIHGWFSDAMCRLSTGAGFATRALYSDDDERVFAAIRPQLLNGIPDLATRPDLADRTIGIALPRIEDDDRRTEAELLVDFEAALPEILGALLTGVSAALRNLQFVKLDRPPRMADFARVAAAAAPGLGWTAEDFLIAYAGNRRDGVVFAIEASPVAGAIEKLMNEVPTWSGSASELLTRLGSLADDGARRAKSWPRSPTSMGSEIRRVAPVLRAVGIEVTTDRVGHDRHRVITIKRQVPQ